MKRALVMFLIPCMLAPSCWSQSPKRNALVNIVISPKATPPEKIAADELSHYLSQLYPGVRFEVVDINPRGVMYGVYNLLEKLGCGFYLSSDTLPAKGKNSFSFDSWELSDAPLVQDRIVFNWHNFLSGCSTWSLSDWKGWITQAQKMGYNGVMVGFSFAPIVSNSKNRAQSMSPSNRSRVTPFCAEQFSNQLTLACKTENNSNCGA